MPKTDKQRALEAVQRCPVQLPLEAGALESTRKAAMYLARLTEAERAQVVRAVAILRGDA